MKARRQELYDRIRETSKEEVILEEMQRLGFWPEGEGRPEGTEAFIKRRGELKRELTQLQTELRRLGDVDRLISDARRERMKQSKQKRQETKLKRLREREQGAKEWKQKQQTEIIYLGENYSGTLDKKKSDRERLNAARLAMLNDAGDLAKAMGIELSELRFLSFQREVSRVNHYKRFRLPKKTGGFREISAPMPKLKQAQEWILQNILYKINLHESAHGFRPKHSIKTNALPHVGAELLINIDLENFFPTVTYKRVFGLFRSLAYSDSLANILALLCTEPDVEEVEIDGESYFVSSGERTLPQGSPASPAITNIICRHLDKRLHKLCEKHGFNYTRYADDMSFSAQQRVTIPIGKFLGIVKRIVKEEGFKIHPKKTHVATKGRQKEVTGIVVNEKPSISRKKLKAFRAVLYQLEKDGPEGKHWGDSDDVISAVKGYADFVNMVDPKKGMDCREQVQRIIKKHAWKPPRYERKGKLKEAQKSSIWTGIKQAFSKFFGG